MPSNPRDAVDRIIPFRYLSPAMKGELLEELTRTRFDAGDTIIEQGARDDRSVYLLALGSVEVVDHRSGIDVVLNVIRPGHYFGEWEPLFDVERAYAIRAIEPVECFHMSGAAFLDIVHRSRTVAQALGTILRDRQRIFAAFDRFRVELTRGVEDGHIDLFRLLPYYRALEPALHPLVADEASLDTEAFLYAIRRLPENLTATFAYLLTDVVPAAYGDPGEVFVPIATVARRREVWEMLPGKSLLLLRSGRSDLTDFVSCLCLYAVEARKIRKRLQDPHYVAALREAGAKPAGDLELPFSADEWSALEQAWGSQTATRLHEIVRHREMFSIDIRRQTRDYNSRSTERWGHQLGSATRDLLGADPSDLSEDIDVHIISSNTHSVSNCLNPWFYSNTDALLAWAREVDHPAMLEHWHREQDLVYAVARDFFIDHPADLAESRRVERASGIHRVEETVSTGVQVQLVDTAAVSYRSVDPGISVSGGSRRALIVNIDYAFGEQAQHIMRNLLILYGRNVRSIGFLGKAGALVGDRGDILAPSAFVEQSTELFQPLPDPDGSIVSELQDALPGRAVHAGTMLTADGTLLQNRLMLNFYRHLWDAVGIEMEGSHYVRQVVESRELGVIPEDTALRFFYYVSDLPLGHSASLSARMSPTEGVPPLYAITRCLLGRILGKE